MIDTGEGIPENSLRYLFDRYYQAPTSQYHIYEGVGIGLSLVKELVEAHDASIEVESVVGKGSKFSILIKIYQDVEVQTATGYSSYLEEKTALWTELWEKTYQSNRSFNLNFKKSTENNVTILLVDDHPEVCEYISNLINDKYQVIIAEDGRAIFDHFFEV